MHAPKDLQAKTHISSFSVKWFANHYFTKAALKTMSPILRRWPTTPKVDVGGMADVEPSSQNYITCCCHVIDDSRKVV